MLAKLQDSGKKEAVLLSSRISACEQATALAEEAKSMPEAKLQACVGTMTALELTLPVRVRCQLFERNVDSLTEGLLSVDSLEKCEEQCRTLARLMLPGHLPFEEAAADPVAPSFTEILSAIDEQYKLDSDEAGDAEKEAEIEAVRASALEAGFAALGSYPRASRSQFAAEHVS